MAISKSEAPTLVDVAREAGVSLKTASRVLNDSENVSEEKAGRVRLAMEQLGYRPNELARGLKAQRSATVGMIVPNLTDPFNANAVHGFQEEARANGYVVILASSGGDVQMERSEVRTLVGRQIDGLVITPADSRRDSFSDLVPAGVHIVTFDQLIQGVRLDSVTVANRRSAQEATAHLVSHGFRRIVAIGARPHVYTCKERVAGYKAAMKAASLQPRVCLVDHESALTSAWLEDEVFANQKADAIFTLNWFCTMRTLRGLRDLGKTAGRDVPLFSFDDFDLADMLTPSLSVIQQPAKILGREAGRLLFRRLKGNGGDPEAVVMPTSMIIRQSCGC